MSRELHALTLTAALLVASTVALIAGPVPTIAGGAAEDATMVGDCGMIDSPGLYHLEDSWAVDSLPDEQAVCIRVTASNVTIDGQGHTITGPEENNGWAILSRDGVENLTLRNVTLDNWSTGVRATEHTTAGIPLAITITGREPRGLTPRVKAVSSMGRSSPFPKT